MKTNLTKQQLHDLATIVFEQNGCLTSDGLDEQIALVLELE
jgi:hypothetical protein